MLLTKAFREREAFQDKAFQLFITPSNFERRDLWEITIRKISGQENFSIKSNDRFCEKHFWPKDILREWIATDSDGRILQKVPYLKPHLSKTAVPSNISDVGFHNVVVETPKRQFKNAFEEDHTNNGTNSKLTNFKRVRLFKVPPYENRSDELLIGQGTLGTKTSGKFLEGMSSNYRPYEIIHQILSPNAPKDSEIIHPLLSSSTPNYTELINPLLLSSTPSEIINPLLSSSTPKDSEIIHPNLSTSTPNYNETIYPHLSPSTPNDNETIYPHLSPSTQKDNETIYPHLSPSTPKDNETIYPHLSPSTPKDNETIYPHLSPSTPKDNETIYPHLSPSNPKDNDVRHVEQECDENIAPGQHLFNKLTSHAIPLPSGWYQLNHNGKERFVILFNLEINDNNLPVWMKAIYITSDLTFRFTFRGQEIDISQLGTKQKYIVVENDVHTLIEYVNMLNLCQGAMKSRKYSHDSSVKHGSVENDVWRANNCLILCTSGVENIKCLQCRKLRRCLLQRIRRAKKNTPVVRLCHLTPRSKLKIRNLRHKVHTSQVVNKRVLNKTSLLEKQLEKNKSIVKAISEDVFVKKIEDLNVSISEKIVMKEIFKSSKVKSKQGSRYSEDWLMLCILLHIRSPSAYKFVCENNILPLPCIRTIRRYFGLVKSSCGFDEEFFQALRKRLDSQPIQQRHGILILDEISLRESASVCSQTLTYKGLIDFGNEAKGGTTLSDKANHGLVLMLQMFADSFRQPVAVFASRGPTTSLVLTKIVLKVIVLLENAGVFVDAIVTDAAATNRKMWKELGVSGTLGEERNFFLHPYDDTRKIFVFSDTPHLIKCVRNRLASDVSSEGLKVNPDKNLVKWTHIQILYEADCKHPAALRVCPKLSSAHINLTNTNKMRVRLATQVFSNSVATGLEFYRHYKTKGLENCQDTQHFCLFFNNLFDALNRRYAAEGLRIDGSDFKVLADSLYWLNEWETRVHEGKIRKEQFLTKVTADGLRVTILSAMQLTTYLLKECHFSYVLTAKMNQDPLENFFGMIRQAAGSNDHPSTPTFLQLYKILSIFSILKPPKYGNCYASQETSPLLTISDFKKIFKEGKNSSKIEEIKSRLNGLVLQDDWDCDIINEEHNYSGVPIVNCIVYYVTGYLCRQLLKKVKCEICRSALVNPETQEGLCHELAGHLVNLKTRGKLIHPNIRFYHIINSIETAFSKNCHSITCFEDTLDYVLNNGQLSFPCLLHKEEIMVYTVRYYILMRMRQYTWQNFSNQENKNRHLKKSSKLVKS